MQVQNLHVAVGNRMTSRQQLQHLIQKEGLKSLYRGLTPEILKVIPMVGTMFVVYEQAKEIMNVTHDRR
jgi:solute carrier family 25 (mitochondrial phosphate transporter), member 23/24/25/41